MSVQWQAMRVDPLGNGVRLTFDEPTTEVWLPVSAEEFYAALQRQQRIGGEDES